MTFGSPFGSLGPLWAPHLGPPLDTSLVPPLHWVTLWVTLWVTSGSPSGSLIASPFGAPFGAPLRSVPIRILLMVLFLVPLLVPFLFPLLVPFGYCLNILENWFNIFELFQESAWNTLKSLVLQEIQTFHNSTKKSNGNLYTLLFLMIQNKTVYVLKEYLTTSVAV